MENKIVKKELFHSVKHCADALTAMTDKLGWLSELEEKAKEAGLDVRFS